MGKLTISMAMFNSKLLVYQRVSQPFFSFQAPYRLLQPRSFLIKNERSRRHIYSAAWNGTNMIVTVIIPMALCFQILPNVTQPQRPDVMTHPHDVQLI